MSSVATDESASTTERWGAALLIVVAVVLHATALLNARPLQSANDRSRWCTVWSLVERGTFQIDEIRQVPGWDSIDIIYDDGHFYSTKPPLLTVIVAGVTWCVQRITGWSLEEQTQPVTAAVLLVVNIIPFTLSLLVLWKLLTRVSQTAWCRLFVLATASFATLATPFLMTLNNHTVAVVGVICSLYALERILSDESPRGWAFVLCGLSAGWVCANELPAAAFGLATFVLAVRKSIRQTILWYVPAALIPIIAFLATNVIATGSWKPTYANYGSSKYNFVVDGIPSYWSDPDGVDRNLDSPAVYFLHSTIGHHGIFSLTPLFLLALLGWIASGSVRNQALKTLIRLGAVMSVIVIAFYMTRFDNYNYGGVSCSLRWALWLIPFWLLALVPVIDFGARYAVMRWLQVVLFGLSAMSAWLPIENPWQQPWLFKRMEAWKWIDYTRKPAPLPRTLWTWFLTVPDSGATAEDSPWLELTSANLDGSILRRRLAVQKQADHAQPGVIQIEVQEAADDKPLVTVRQFAIDVKRFSEGAPVIDCVRWLSDVSPEQKVSDLTFIRGLPLKKEYRAGKIRYLSLPMRTDAFRCQTAAATVDFPVDDPLYQYRCDTWLCDELPFGVAQFEIRVTDIESGGLIRYEHWSVSNCYPAPAAVAPHSIKNPQ